MADNNRNQDERFYGENQGWRENYDQMNRNRDYDRYRENEGSFGNAGYRDFNRGGEFNRMNYGGQPNRVNYIPDNDDNRYDRPGSGLYEDRYRGYAQGDNMGQQRNQWGTHYGASFGNQNRQSNQGNYGGQSGWRSVNDISGGYDINYNDRNDDWRRGDRNWQGSMGNQYGDYSNRRHDVNYGGNTASDWNNEVRNKDDRGWWDRERRDVSTWMSDTEEYREPRGNRNYPTTLIRGEHRGKGPRGYQRSDERIREDVCDRLADDEMLDASDIEVDVKGAEVILSGTVLSREAKRQAEDLVESISGVRNIENRIRVGRADELDGNFTTRQVIRAAGNNEQEDPNKRNRR